MQDQLFVQANGLGPLFFPELHSQFLAFAHFTGVYE